MAKSSKQQLDELLGIMDELSKEDSVPPSPPISDINTSTLIDTPGQVNTIPNDPTAVGNEQVINSTPTTPTIAPSTIQPMQFHDPMNLMQKDDAELVATQKNLAEIDELIAVSKNVMQHVYGAVTSTDIVDASTISAAAKLISETRALIAEHLTIQKNERDYLNRVQMENIKHMHQMELMEKKFELEQRRYQQKNPPIANAPANNIQGGNQSPSGMKSYSSADLMKMISGEQ